MLNPLLSAEEMAKVFETIFRCNEVPRWTSYTNDVHTVLNKEGHNAMVVFFLAADAEHEGAKINWDLFPIVALYHIFKKAIFKDISREALKGFATKVDHFDDEVDRFMHDEIAAMSNDRFADFIMSVRGTRELKLYSLACSIATNLDAEGLVRIMSDDNITETSANVCKRLMEDAEKANFKNILPYTQNGSPLKNLLYDFGRLKYKKRWAGYYNAINQCVMGHSFTVAAYGYLLHLYGHPEDHEMATTKFFTGIFHDVPEIWTGDIPRPLKNANRVIDEALTKMELSVIHSKIYDRVPKYSIARLKKYMLNEINEEIARKHKGNTTEARWERKFHKEADAFAAVVEAHTQCMAGSEDPHFKEVYLREFAGYWQKTTVDVLATVVFGYPHMPIGYSIDEKHGDMVKIKRCGGVES